MEMVPYYFGAESLSGHNGFLFCRSVRRVVTSLEMSLVIIGDDKSVYVVATANYPPTVEEQWDSRNACVPSGYTQ
jgi:hypothetical protein